MSRGARLLLRLGLFGLALFTVPHRLAGRDAAALFDGDAAAQETLARGVEHWLHTSRTPRIRTGAAVIDGEWAFATWQMAALGYAQIGLEHPETRARNLARADECLDRALSKPIRAFDTLLWDEDPLESLDGDHDHAAYLGYVDLSLSYARLLDWNDAHAEINDRITAALVRRLEHSTTLMLQTYPGDVYPPDNTAVAGAIALYDRATGADHSALLHRWAERVRKNYTDPKTGLLYQHLRVDGRPDAPGRGSGTALGVYFLSFLDDPISAELDRALTRELDGDVLGFGAVREYAAGSAAGHGDVDSGPLVLGFSPVATGFSLAGARLTGDRARFARYEATAVTVGIPVSADGGERFVFGGPVGDAILFAMRTAQPPARIHR